MQYGKLMRAAALGAAIYLASEPVDAQKKRPAVVATGILKGSPAALDEQNRKMREYNLSTIPDNEALERMVTGKYLIRMPMQSRHYYLRPGMSATRTYEPSDPRLGRNYTRPWVKLFIDRFSSQYYPKCGARMRVNSLVRTWEDQLLEPNGSKRSPHPSGSTADIANINMCAGGKRWTRQVLSDLDKKGYIEATEEHHPPHFHVMVYPSYVDYVASLSKKSPKKPPARRR